MRDGDRDLRVGHLGVDAVGAVPEPAPPASEGLRPVLGGLDARLHRAPPVGVLLLAIGRRPVRTAAADEEPERHESWTATHEASKAGFPGHLDA